MSTPLDTFNVNYMKVDDDTYIINRQVVNGVYIPELKINILATSADITIDSALRIVAENLTINSFYYNGTERVLTETGKFYADAFEREISGVINFTDIGASLLSDLLGMESSEPTTLGEFSADNKEVSPSNPNGRVAQSLGYDFEFNVDVPLLQKFVNDQRDLFGLYRSALDNGQISTGERGVSYSVINFGINNALSNVFTILSAHEVDGHGNNTFLDHDPNLRFASQLERDPAYNAEWYDAFNTGVIYASQNTLLGIVGRYREGEAGSDALLGFKQALLSQAEKNISQGSRLSYFTEGSVEDYINTTTKDDGTLSIIVQNQFFQALPQVDPVTGAILPTGLRRNSTGSIEDNKGRLAAYDVEYVDGQPVIRRSRVTDGTADGGLGVTIEKQYANNRPISTDIQINGNPIGIEFSDFGSVLGQQLGYRLAGGNELAGILTSAALKTLGDNLGDVLDGIVGHQSTKNAISDAIATTGEEFLTNLKSAGIGAISSFLTAELVNAIGLHGFAGQVANTASGAVVGQVLTNIVDGAALFDGVNLTMVGNAIGSFVGSFLASKVISFDTVGGQIGASVGAALAPIGVTALLAPAGLALTPIGFAVVAFIGFIAGGLIGSLFGGTPRSGADSVWDASQQKFVVDNVWSKKGGSKDAARSVASAVSDTFNAVLSAAGGTLLNPELVRSGNYGMRKKAFVYKPYSTRDSDAITQKFSGKDAATRLIGYGVYTGLTDPDFQIVGGDIYVKRALYNTFSLGGLDPRNFDTNVLMGNISSAQQYESYLANSTVINALVSAEPNSVFAIETLLTLARADELGLTRRAASDWFGGFSYLMSEAQTGAANVEFGFDYDPFSGQISRLIGVGDYVLGDAIDIAGQTTIEGTVAGETIDLRSGRLADQRGFTVDGHLNDDIAVAGADFTSLTTGVTFAAADLRKTVIVTVANDGLAEATEAFLGKLSNAPGMQIMGGEAVATIVDGTAALPTLMVGNSYAWEKTAMPCSVCPCPRRPPPLSRSRWRSPTTKPRAWASIMAARVLPTSRCRLTASTGPMRPARPSMRASRNSSFEPRSSLIMSPIQITWLRSSSTVRW